MRFNNRPIGLRKKFTLQLIRVRCLLVGPTIRSWSACSLTKSDLQSLDFVINKFFMKLFTTKNIEIVKYCQEYFGFALPSVLWVLWAKRVSKFELSFKCFCLLCNCFVLIWFVLFIFLSYVCLANKDFSKPRWTRQHALRCTPKCYKP